MVRVEVDADVAYENALARRAKVESPPDATPRQLKIERDLLKQKQKALDDLIKEHVIKGKIYSKIDKQYLIWGEKYKKAALGRLKQVLAGEAEGGPEVPRGKGKGKGLEGAIATGMKAAGILLLIAAIHKATSQSKIVGMVESTISKALGLLVDLILLPFLPLITWGIIQLYNSIMDFNKIWGLLDPNDPLGLFAFLMGIPLILTDTIISPLGFAIGRGIGELLTDPIISQMLKDWADFNNIINNSINIIKTWWGGLISNWTDLITGIKSWIIQIQNLLANSSVGQGLGWTPKTTEAEEKTISMFKDPRDQAALRVAMVDYPNPNKSMKIDVNVTGTDISLADKIKNVVVVWISDELRKQLVTNRNI